MKASKEHGPYIVNDEVAVIPEWRNGCSIYMMNSTSTWITVITANQLLLSWKWQDSTPCGIKE